MVLASGSTSAYEGGKRFSFDYLPPTQTHSNNNSEASQLEDDTYEEK